MKFSTQISLCTPSLSPSMSNISVCGRLFRLSSAKLQQLDCLLRTVRNKQERALVFCQMPQMLDLLEKFFKHHHIKFLCIQNSSSNQQKIRQIELFTNRKHILVLLTSTSTSPPPPSAACQWPNNLSNVVFFDSNWNNTVTAAIDLSGKNGVGHQISSLAPCLAWCRQLNQRMAFLPLLESSIQSNAFLSFSCQTPNLRVYRLVCEDTVEDSISKKKLQQKLLGDLKLRNNNKAGDVSKSIVTDVAQSNLGDGNIPANFWKIKRQTLEDLLFNNQHPPVLPVGGGNGLFNTKPETTKENNKVIFRQSILNY